MGRGPGTLDGDTGRDRSCFDPPAGVIRLASEAERQAAELLQHYARLARPEAGRNLIAALDQAAAQIERSSGAGLQAPRPYPFLVQIGRLWIKVGRYWIAYSTTDPPVILAIFHDAANIPERLLP